MEEKKVSLSEIIVPDIPTDSVYKLSSITTPTKERDHVKTNTPEERKIPINEHTEESTNSERMILYYSDFEINVNDWCTEYENLTIFKMNLKQVLGDSWNIYISLLIKPLPLPTPQNTTYTFKKNILDLSMQFFLLINRTLPKFEEFYENFMEYAVYHNFAVYNNAGGQLESLMKNFHIAAREAYEKMVRKIENDRVFEVGHRSQEFQKAITKFREGGGYCIRKTAQEGEGKRASKKKAGWRYSSGLLPGFTLIRNRIITPLITTSEKIVDYMTTKGLIVIYIYIYI